MLACHGKPLSPRAVTSEAAALMPLTFPETLIVWAVTEIFSLCPTI